MSESGKTLEAALADHRDATAEAAGVIDVTAAVLAAIEPTPARPLTPARPPRRWRWRLVAAPAMAIAVVVLAWLVWPRSSEFVRAAGDVRVNDRVVADGERVELPARFVAGERRGARLSSPRTELALWPAATMSLSAPRRVGALRGGVTITSEREARLETEVGVIRGRGVFDVETRQEGAPMTLTRNHKISGAVVLAVAVSAGWIIFRDADGVETRVDEPNAAVVDGAGKVTTLGPRDRVAGKAGASSAGEVGAQPGGDGPTVAGGAFWDEGEKRIVFALAGEVVDGATGEAVESFDLVAEPIRSDDYSQGNQVKRSFRDQAGGNFVLNNLGLGTWRVEVRADGYAPSTQTAKLDDLYANPLLLFPLTRGAQVTGQVVDWKEQPVKGARVGQPECLGKNPGPGCLVVTSDEDGNFVLPAMPEERAFALRAEHDKYGFAELKDLRQAEGSTRHVVIRLSGVLRIHGTVVRGKDSAPVSGAVVGVDSGERIETGVTGRYELLVPLVARPEAFVESDPGRPKSRARIVSYPDRRSARELEWVNADTHVAEVEIDFQLQMESATITGVVTGADGKPLADLELHFANTAGWKRGRDHETFPTLARTDAAGRYRLDDVPFEAGYNVSYHDDEDRRVRLGFVTVAGEEVVVANFTIGGGGIRGEFVDDKGARFAASMRGCGRLGARASDGTHILPRCYPDGRFEFSKLAPGKYTLENMLPRQSSPLEITSVEVDVPAGDVVTDIKVPVEGEPSTEWRLRILDAAGRFVPGVAIRYNHGMTMFTSSLDVEADGLARVSLSRLYKSFFIDAPGYRPVEVDLASRDPATIIELRMERKAGE